MTRGGVVGCLLADAIMISWLCWPLVPFTGGCSWPGLETRAAPSRPCEQWVRSVAVRDNWETVDLPDGGCLYRSPDGGDWLNLSL